MIDVTSIIELLESRFGLGICKKVAVMLCLGGNDFIPKFHGFSHEKWMIAIFENRNILDNLIEFNVGEDGVEFGQINEIVFLEAVKIMYSPASLDHHSASLEQVRQLSINYPGKPFKHPTSWMPPRSALQQLVKLINCFIAYLTTSMDPSAFLPNFLQMGCFEVDKDGIVKYDFGNEVHTKRPEDLLTYTEDEMKRLMG